MNRRQFLTGIAACPLAEIAGVAPPSGTDGISMVPALTGKAFAGRTCFYWEFHEQGFTQALRLGDWKGVRNTSSANPIELYNLAGDLGETTDAASQHPEVVAKIAGILRTARVPSPGYPVPGEPL